MATNEGDGGYDESDTFIRNLMGLPFNPKITCSAVVEETQRLRRVLTLVGLLVVLGLTALETVFQSISGRLPERGRKRREKIAESITVQTSPPAPTASAIGPCPTIIQIVGRPGTESLPSTIAPPDQPQSTKTVTYKACHLMELPATWGGGRVVQRCWVNFQCRGVLQFGYSRARAYCARSRCGWGLFGHFYSPLSFLSSFSLSLGDGSI